MKKGFTLIELLAVIVILAIIAIIATPIVLNIINDTKESAVLRSAEFYLDVVELSIAQSVLENKNLDGIYNIKNGDVCLNNDCDEALEIEANGEVPKSGTITIESGQISDISLVYGDKTIIINEKGELAYKLAPGLYDENDNLIYTWEELTTEEYVKYQCMDDSIEDYVEVTSSILIVDENGVLTTPINYDVGYDIGYDISASSEYLVGKLVIDDSVTSIDQYAFRACTSLTSITIPDSVTSIGYGAFKNCTNLTSIKVDKNNPKYDSRNNSNAIIETTKNRLIVGCQNTIIPESVTIIGQMAFSGSGLTSISIPNGVTSIYPYAFENCTNLTSITIPDSVTSIGNTAFTKCTNLTTIYYKGTATGATWGAKYATVQ